MLKALFAAALCAATAAPGLAADSENLSLGPGVKLGASSFLSPYAPRFAADGDAKTKESRWVSSLSESCPQWLRLEFQAETEVNAAALTFWDRGHLAQDFDLQLQTESGWKTLREIRGNDEERCAFAFPTAKAKALRVLFLKAAPDDVVRVYEFETRRLPSPVELRVQDQAPLFPGMKGFAAQLNLFKDAPETFKVEIKTLEDGKAIQEKEITAEVSKSARVELPPAPNYGRYAYEITVRTLSGAKACSSSLAFFNLPPSVERLTSSPFGAHFHDVDKFAIRQAGVRWLRNHDIYGLWQQYCDAKGVEDWSALETSLAYVKENDLRLCYMFLGAPKPYSSVFPGENAANSKSEIYSFYPPSDLDAWSKKYLLKAVELEKKDAPLMRAYEIWNEAWSYYRLRGLQGTPAEAFAIVKASYETLKKADPDVICYPTDVKTNLDDSRYAYRNFGRDMLEMGYLRYADAFSYHGYGMGDAKSIESMRRTVWSFGRDFAIWNTESAVEGRPFYELMESLAIQRASGNARIFIYNGAQWAPLMENGAPTMNLVGMAALIRNLSDALPLGEIEGEGVRGFLFGSGGKPVALLFSDSETPVKAGIPLSPDAKALDVFGRKAPLAAEATLSKSSPLFIEKPSADFVKKTVAAQLERYASESLDGSARELLKGMAQRLAQAKDSHLDAATASLEGELLKARAKGGSEFLYSANKSLELLLNLKTTLARGKEPLAQPPSTLRASLDAVAALWKEINAKNQGGALLDAERLASGAQRKTQAAMMYDVDKDAVARELFLESAGKDVALAKTKLKTEQVSQIYKAKTYFRSMKRSLRTELYCFPNGRFQEAAITLDNPFDKELAGQIELKLPAGWTARDKTLQVKVAPFSRAVFRTELKAPELFKSGEVETVEVSDANGNFPTAAASCEVVKEVPPFPALVGPLIGGALTGN